MKFVALPTLAAAALLAGCDKYAGPTEVSGMVVDRHTGQPVAGAYVVAVGASSSWAGGSSTSAGTTADAQGRFAFRFEASAKSQYQVGTSTASGYTNQGNGPVINGGQKNDNLVINADAPAWVRINCVDDLPYGKVGLFTAGYLNAITGGYDQQNIGPGNYSFVRPVFSYSSLEDIYWRTTGWGNTIDIKEGRIPYFVAGFDTATVTIHF